MHTTADTAPSAIVIVNLGTPEAPTPRAVRRYLAEFLHDHRVVQLTRWLWCPLLHFVILPLPPRTGCGNTKPDPAPRTHRAHAHLH